MDRIDEIKIKLKKIRRQKKRREYLETIDISSFSEEEISRFRMLEDKARQRYSILKGITLVGLSVYLPSWFLCFAAVMFIPDFFDENRGLSMLDLLVGLASSWALIGIPILICLFIALLIWRNNPKYYLNIKNI